MAGESDIESKTCKFAAGMGLYARKFTSHHAKVPDRVIVGPVTLFLEFKDHGKKPDPGQQDEIETICKVGGFATWVDNIDDAFTLVKLVRDNDDLGLRVACNLQNYWMK